MTDNELIDKTNRAISELVIEKTSFKKAYNYYHGIMDKEQFRYLEENFGIGTPTSVKFIPLIKKHIDALVGEYLGFPINPIITCVDSETISNIARQKQLEISSAIYKKLQDNLQNKLLEFIQTGDEKKLVDPFIKSQLDNIVQDIQTGFTSQYEIAANNVLTYLMQSRSIDLKTKLSTLFIDLLVTGYSFYEIVKEGDGIQMEVYSPKDVFPDENYSSPYVKDSYRIVVRKYLTSDQILNKYHEELTEDDIAQLRGSIYSAYDDRAYIKLSSAPSQGILADHEMINSEDGEPLDYNWRLIPVYEVQWVEADENFVMQRYKTVKINDSIYILRGIDENATRSRSNPKAVSLSVNGVFFRDRAKKPFSLVLACADLQDEYNIMHYYRDNLIANSGTTGDWLDVSLLPTFLGESPTERIEKWLAYKKNGTGLLDSSQEGRQSMNAAPINTIFNGYDNTVKVNAVQAVQMVIEAIEQTTSSITGVFKERLNGIQQRDAVTNVQTSVNNSFIVTKRYYQQMDLITEESLTDALNTAKWVFKDGITGTLILGEHRKQIFTALPQHFTLSDFNIHVSTSSEMVKDLEQLRAIVPQFVQAGIMDPDIILDIMTTKSTTQLKQKVTAAMKAKKEENNVVKQLQEQLQQAEQQMNQMKQQLQQSQAKLEQLNEQKMQLEKERMQLDYKVNWYKAQTDRNFKTNQAENDTKRTEIELEQMHDGNPYNDQIKQV